MYIALWRQSWSSKRRLAFVASFSFRVVTSGGLRWKMGRTPGFHQMRSTSWLAEQLLASKIRLFSMASLGWFLSSLLFWGTSVEYRGTDRKMSSSWSLIAQHERDIITVSRIAFLNAEHRERGVITLSRNREQISRVEGTPCTALCVYC
jgi:hypothetical protein